MDNLSPQDLSIALNKEATPMTQGEIDQIFFKNLGSVDDVKRRINYVEAEKIFEDGILLNQDEYAINLIELKFMTRFCRTHSSYVLKDMPNIQIPPINPSIYEYKQHAANIEQHLYQWWSDENILAKLKSGVLRACFKGDMVYYLSVDSVKKTVHLNRIEPDLFAYETITSDPLSPIKWIMRAELIDLAAATIKFPQIKGKITSTASVSKFAPIWRFKSTDLYSLDKAIYVQIMDQNYVYHYINDIEIQTAYKHNYPMIPFYIHKYFDIGKKWGMSLTTLIKDPIKFINQLLGYKYDIAMQTSNAPLIVIGSNADISIKERKGGLIKIPSGAVQYLQPPQSPLNLTETMNIMKSFLHLLSGISEESMAGFTGALTSAGVSIELRMDSTIREAIDLQITLQKIIQDINRDYLILMEKNFPNKNLHESAKDGVVSDIEFKGSQIAGYYKNIVDFGGILPRSLDQIIRNNLALYQAKVISQDTLLENLRYANPSMEMDKIRREKIDQFRLDKDLQAGQRPDQIFFDNPKDEEDYIYTKNKLPIPNEAQNHDQHLDSHLKQLAVSPHPLLNMHIIMTQNMKAKQQQAPAIAPSYPDQNQYSQYSQ
jgi:hypothetical protein